MAGIPTARNVDHVGLTVPDMDEAIAFFVDYLGCELAWRVGPFESANDDWMVENMNVDPRASCYLAMLRMGPTFNVELFQYTSPDQRQELPKNSDFGGSHLAIWVDDIDLAAEYLRSVPGVNVQGVPKLVDDGSAAHNNRWCYFTTPWGAQMELVSPIGPLKYEETTEIRMAPRGPGWSVKQPYAV